MTPEVWDSDTGILTLTATDANGAAVNLIGTVTRVVKVRSMRTGIVTAPTVTDTNLAGGIVSATVTSLGAGRYQAVLRVTDSSGNTYTYPSADQGPAYFEVKADLDAA